MIKIFDSTDVEFDSNGIKVINPHSLEYCDSSLKNNSDYYLEMRTKDLTYQNELKIGNIIVVTDVKYLGTEMEAFRISELNYIDGCIDVKALQLYYDTARYVTRRYKVESSNGYTVLNDLNIAPAHPFTFYGDVPKTATYELKEGSLEEKIMEIQEHHGGVLYRNLFNIGLLKRNGVDTEIRLELGKNVTGFKKEENWDEVVTNLLPVSDYNDGTFLSDVESEKWMKSDMTYNIPYYRTVEFNLRESYVEGLEEGTAEYLSRVRMDLRQQAENYIELHRVPNFKYEIDISNLKQRVHLGDSVICYIPQIGETDLYAEVIEIEYDHIANDYKTVTIGNYVSSKPIEVIRSMIGDNSQISSISRKTNDNAEKVYKMNLSLEELTTIKQYDITLGEYGGKKYGSKLQLQGNSVDADLDITFGKTINANSKVCIASIPDNLIPSMYLANNFTTNKGVVGGRFSVEQDGKLYWFTGKQSIVYSESSPDGFRTHFSYSVKRV